MRACKSVDIMHVYRVMHKASPPVSQADSYRDPSWALRTQRYDTISTKFIFQEAKEVLDELQVDDGVEAGVDIAGDAIAANPEGLLDLHEPRDAQNQNPYGNALDIDSSDMEEDGDNMEM
jgi:hypothetical protein